MFAEYTILRPLGAGGMGKVYLVQHPRLPRRDALKILPEHLTDDAECRQRFSREAHLAAGLSHPNIVGIDDRGEFEGLLWISMEYVDGTSINVENIRRERIAPAVNRAEWSRAGITAANRLETPGG